MPKDRQDKSDRELFRRAVKGARPLKGPQRDETRPPRAAPLPVQRERDERAVLDELLLPADDVEGVETGEELLFLRPGHRPRDLRQLRRGRFAVQDELDLHQMTQDMARAAILDFVSRSVSRGFGCVRIVHGKGLRSPGEPKLKNLANRLLRRHPSVVAFASCRPADGGTGAVVVLLKRG